MIYVVRRRGISIVKERATLKMHKFLTKQLYILPGTETRQLFCRMFVTLKFVKELFYSTYNGITASVSFVSLTLVVLNVR